MSKNYNWIRDIEKYILTQWMASGMTATWAKKKRYSNVNDWYIYEDYYDKYQTCYILVENLRIARAMVNRLTKVIKKLGYSEYFWADYGNTNSDYENAPCVVIGVNSSVVDFKKLENLHTVIKIKGACYD